MIRKLLEILADFAKPFRQYKIPESEAVGKVDATVKAIKGSIMTWECPRPSHVQDGVLILGIIRHRDFETSLGILIAVADDCRLKPLLVANRIDECIPHIARYYDSVRAVGSMFDQWNLHLVKDLVDEATRKIRAAAWVNASVIPVPFPVFP